MSLPSGYKLLEYIQSTGTQYVDTKFKANNNTRVLIDAEYIDTSGDYPVLFGARTNVRQNMFSLMYNTRYFRSDYNTTYTQQWESAATGRRIYDKNKETTTINGVSQSYTNSAFQCDVNLTLLCLNNNGTKQWFASAKVYSCKIYDNGTIIRDYIPCQTASGDIGLLDDVNSVFYGNAGTGTFIAGPVIAIAADKSEVTKLEYIKSSGVEAINTGRIIYSENMRVTMRFAYTAEHGSSSLFGSEASGVSGSGEYSMVPWGTPQFFVGGSKALTSAYTPQLNEVCTLDITADNGILTDVWNESTRNSQSYTQKLNHTYSIAIFGNNISGTISQKSSIKLYSFQLYDNGELARDYIAAKLADGTVGLYDKLNGLLYINVGTGTFDAGPVKEPPDAPTNLQHLLAVRLAWSAVDGATGYNVYRDDVLLASTTETTFIDLTAAENTEYTYAVSAVNSTGESSKTTITVYTKSGYFLYKPYVESATFQ